MYKTCPESEVKSSLDLSWAKNKIRFGGLSLQTFIFTILQFDKGEEATPDLHTAPFCAAHQVQFCLVNPPR